ncbi:flavodoxin domain-containing protein [Arthrobacter sp. NyZ413]|uniref:flavodoxin domain-containing protein n=1 Tax=Arthrobacter sp. NyZ413 TaxID=3144669 RepID=UPI003BF87610
MKRIFITYGTSEGQTAKIADVIADVLRHLGHEVTVREVAETGNRMPAGYDGAVIGAPVHLGKHDKHVIDFVNGNLDILRGLASAFFSVSLAAHGDPADAQRYLEQFEDETGWRPNRVGVFAGALPYTHYGIIKRYVMKAIAGSKPGDLGRDISRDYVYTEWDDVRKFAEDFAAGLAARPLD